MSDRVLILNKANYHSPHHAASGRVVLLDNTNTTNQQNLAQLNVNSVAGGAQAPSGFRFIRMGHVGDSSGGTSPIQVGTTANLIQGQTLQIKVSPDPIVSIGKSSKLKMYGIQYSNMYSTKSSNERFGYESKSIHEQRMEIEIL